jgi:hypothetical protein
VYVIDDGVQRSISHSYRTVLTLSDESSEHRCEMLLWTTEHEQHRAPLTGIERLRKIGPRFTGLAWAPVVDCRL